MTTKTVYLYDQVSGEYQGAYSAQASPLDPGSFITPVSSTQIPPPQLSANQAAIFSGGVWSVVPDFRNATVYDQTTGLVVSITTLGTLTANQALTPPPPTLLQAQTKQVVLINNAAQGALLALVSSYPPEEVATWPNQYSEAQAYTANATAPTPTLSAIAMGAGLTVAQVATVVLQKAAAYTAASGAIVGKRKLRTAQIQAATDVPTVQAVTW